MFGTGLLLRGARRLLKKEILVYPHESWDERQQIYGTRYKKTEQPELATVDSEYVPVQLSQDVFGLGRKGEVVEVRYTRMRSFLFPNQLARYLKYHEHLEYKLHRDDLAHWFAADESSFSLYEHIRSQQRITTVGSVLRRARIAVLNDELDATGADADSAADTLSPIAAANATLTSEDRERDLRPPEDGEVPSAADAARFRAEDPLRGTAVSPDVAAKRREAAQRRAAGLKIRIENIASKRRTSTLPRTGSTEPTL
eukprot:TRINITY_DN68399_c0_g1_i1.p1 TRINITY_DN68399_c0_g1~~TRINITY_DN68399_c0_g1_i1.p1  ORF type:complete len:256 (+),score=41.09 TRINITY_DN68399_c0_g1_i1:96-863(+)